MNIFRSLLCIIIAVMACSCGFKQNTETAGRAVNTFHQQFNESKFAEIYAATTPLFKASAAEPAFLKFIQAVHTKLGNYKSSTQNGWHVNTTPAGTVVKLTFSSQFEHGSATESFTYTISGESAVLQGYNINSSELITN